MVVNGESGRYYEGYPFLGGCLIITSAFNMFIHVFVGLKER